MRLSSEWYCPFLSSLHPLLNPVIFPFDNVLPNAKLRRRDNSILTITLEICLRGNGIISRQKQPFIDPMTTTEAKKNGSRVRVGVRVRPLSFQEIKQEGNCSLDIDSSTIRMGRRIFTYDTVFDSNYDQTELYESVSSPLLESFIEGYNATVGLCFLNRLFSVS